MRILQQIEIGGSGSPTGPAGGAVVGDYPDELTLATPLYVDTDADGNRIIFFRNAAGTVTVGDVETYAATGAAYLAADNIVGGYTNVSGGTFQINSDGSFSYLFGGEQVKLGKTGIVTEKGLATAAITGGALPTTTFVSGTGKQILTTRDVDLLVPITYTLIGGTCAVALSPDNVTYSTLITIAPGVAGEVAPVQLHVPAAWYVKLTLTNATSGTATYY